jgi:hypothetical protein
MVFLGRQGQKANIEIQNNGGTCILPGRLHEVLVMTWKAQQGESLECGVSGRQSGGMTLNRGAFLVSRLRIVMESSAARTALFLQGLTTPRSGRTMISSVLIFPYMSRK